MPLPKDPESPINRQPLYRQVIMGARKRESQREPFAVAFGKKCSFQVGPTMTRWLPVQTAVATGMSTMLPVRIFVLLVLRHSGCVWEPRNHTSSHLLCTSLLASRKVLNQLFDPRQWHTSSKNRNLGGPRPPMAVPVPQVGGVRKRFLYLFCFSSL